MSGRVSEQNDFNVCRSPNCSCKLQASRSTCRHGRGLHLAESPPGVQNDPLEEECYITGRHWYCALSEELQSYCRLELWIARRANRLTHKKQILGRLIFFCSSVRKAKNWRTQFFFIAGVLIAFFNETFCFNFEKCLLSFQVREEPRLLKAKPKLSQLLVQKL